MEEFKRPLELKIVSFFILILSFSYLLFGVNVLFDTGDSEIFLGASLKIIFYILGGILIFLGIFGFFITNELIKKKKRSKSLAIIFVILGILGGYFFIGLNWMGLICILINLIVLFYLTLNKNMKKIFSKE